MSKQLIDLGSFPNDDTGDTLREGGDKINDNFNEIYLAFGDGSTLLDVVNDNLELDVPNKSNKISFVYNNTTALSQVDASTYEGCLAFVKSTGALYYANNGEWLKLITDTSQSKNYTNYTDPLKSIAYDGLLSSLIDVDGTVSPQNGYVLKWNDSKSKWEAAVDIAATGSGLNADTLESQPGSYYLDYNNFTNIPSIPSLTSDLTNDANFVSFDSNTETLFYESLEINSDFIPEGNVNFYYTESKFLTDLELYYERVSAFDNGHSIDSVYKCNAQFTSSQSKNLINVEKINNFRINDKIRIYGADDTANDVSLVKTSNLAINSVSRNGFSAGAFTVRYNAAEMDINTGKITTRFYSTNDSNRRIEINNLSFNKDNNIQLQIGSIPADKVLLLYRSINSTSNNNFKLFAVITQKDLNDSGNFIDYYDFDYTPWGGKNPQDNTYPNDIIHVPVNPPTSPKRGWVDKCISNIDYNQNTIELNENVTVDSSSFVVNLAHNDSQLILNAIDQQKANGKSALLLNGKTYVIETLKLPSNFSLLGFLENTKIIKLPWSVNVSALDPSPNKNLIKSENYNSILDRTENINNSSLQNIIFDGNLLHSYLLDDTSNDEINSAINFGIASENITLKNVKVLNVIGHGIYIPQANNILISECDISNSGLTDRHDYKPLYATEIENSRIINNRFANYSDNVDVSTSEKLVITNNVIDGCGSGLYIFASRYLISYPNVLLGYAGELLPTPDILNSEYDSVNIYLKSGLPYTSDVYVYQENGFVFDLTANDGVINYKLHILEKNQAGVETLSPYTSNNVTLNEVTGFDKTQGEFKFAITAEDVDHIKNTLKTEDVAYTITLTETVPAIENGVLSSGNISGSDYIVSIASGTLKYLFVGAKVTFTNHFNYNPGEGVVSNINGNVLTITDLNLNTSGSGGTINIVNEFILAQGRVL